MNDIKILEDYREVENRLNLKIMFESDVLVINRREREDWSIKNPKTVVVDPTRPIDPKTGLPKNPVGRPKKDSSFPQKGPPRIPPSSQSIKPPDGVKRGRGRPRKYPKPEELAKLAVAYALYTDFRSKPQRGKTHESIVETHEF